MNVAAVEAFEAEREGGVGRERRRTVESGVDEGEEDEEEHGLLSIGLLV